MSFYMKRSFADTELGIELVNIHYTWIPLGQQPDWEAHRETRAMPRGGVLIRGMGGTIVDDTGSYVQSTSERVELPDDRVRRKVIRLPKSIPDPVTNQYTSNYSFHHYYEVFRNGKRQNSPLYTEEIVTKEVEFIDFNGILGGMCIFWSVYDWDSPQYQPTEEPTHLLSASAKTALIAHTSFMGPKIKRLSHALAQRCSPHCPLPRRFVGHIYGPKGAEVVQRWHVGNMWQPNRADRWEDYWGNVVHVL